MQILSSSKAENRSNLSSYKTVCLGMHFIEALKKGKKEEEVSVILKIRGICGCNKKAWLDDTKGSAISGEKEKKKEKSI